MKRSFTLVLICVGIATVYAGNCLNKCPPGTYDKDNDGSCGGKCLDNCNECSDDQSCTKCFTGFEEKVDGTGKKTCEAKTPAAGECGKGTFKDGNSCTKCEDGCMHCDSAKNCLMCTESTMVRIDRDVFSTSCNYKCEPKCVSGDKTTGCFECAAAPNKHNDCAACMVTHTYNGFTGRCDLIPKSALCAGEESGEGKETYFYNTDSSRCLACDLTCNGCEGTASTCSGCYDGFEYDKEKKTCTKKDDPTPGPTPDPDDGSGSSGTSVWVWIGVGLLVTGLIAGGVFLFMQYQAGKSADVDLDDSHQDARDEIEMRDTERVDEEVSGHGHHHHHSDF